MGIEIERKYIIKLPDFSVICKMEEYSVSEIVQTYLSSDVGISQRVRKRTSRGVAVYTQTKKRRIDELSAEEQEREISAPEYEKLLLLGDAALRPIIKTRHVFKYMGQLFEIDVYPEWKSTCIMETELNDRNDVVKIPEFITVLREVTGNGEYSNHGMSRHFPDELSQCQPKLYL